MCLTGRKITVALVTAHVPLRDAEARSSNRRLSASACCLRDFLSRSVSSPRIAVAGLNPHAGESGALGREEIEIIGPAVSELQSRIENGESRISRPVFPRHSFSSCRGGEFDAVLCMYHDQGLIPLKLHAFHRRCECDTWPSFSAHQSRSRHRVRNRRQRNRAAGQHDRRDPSRGRTGHRDPNET